MLARRLTTILPAMTLAEAIETTRIPVMTVGLLQGHRSHKGVGRRGIAHQPPHPAGDWPIRQLPDELKGEPVARHHAVSRKGKL
jgi:hypothetical protein